MWPSSRLAKRYWRLALIGVVVGCTNSTDPTAAIGFCNDLVGAINDKANSCCSSTDQMAPPYQQVTAALTAYQQGCVQLLGDGIRAGHAAYQSPAAWQCLNLIRQGLAAAPCGLGQFDLVREVTLLCPDVIVGQQGAGAPCAGDFECTDPLTCVGYDAKTLGSCAPSPAAGQPCGPGAAAASKPPTALLLRFGRHPSCAAGLACIAGSCHSAPLGQQCADDTQCPTDVPCSVGVCGAAPSVAAGGACVVDKDCQPGLFCQPGTSLGTCTPRNAAGSACNPSSSATYQCLGVCVPQGVCADYCRSG